jgi:hypothetical protein
LQEIALPPFECRETGQLEVDRLSPVLNRDGKSIFHAAGVSFVDRLEGASKPESRIA